MKILLTGTTGYIGSRLLPFLLEKGYTVYCLVRDAKKLKTYDYPDQLHIIEHDLLKGEFSPPEKIDAAYYLIHSMSEDPSEFDSMEKTTAKNFIESVRKTSIKQIIYLSGLVTSHKLSPHLQSRQDVEGILASSSIPLTTLRAGIIIGSSSASFEIIRDLAEKLPFMVAPKWVNSLCQPIGVDDALHYLTSVLDKKDCYGRTFDIGGPDIMTYGQMLQAYAKLRGLKRFILQVPVLTPRLSSYWLYFITSVNFSLAMSLIESVKNNAICTEQSISSTIPHVCIGYTEAIQQALQPIAQTALFKNLDEAKKLVKEKPYLNYLIRIPYHGCFHINIEKPTARKNLEELKKFHPNWITIKETSDELIFYSNNKREYWIYYGLKDHRINLAIWHRPRGLWQRLRWYLLKPLKKKTLKRKLFSLKY